MAFSKVHRMTTSYEWSTPQYLFDELDKEFGFSVDVCALPENAKCKRFYTLIDDGLLQDWDGEIVWMNPPYGKTIGHWMKKAGEVDATVVCLVPARTDTEWWHKYVIGRRAEVRFIKGRLRFGDTGTNAPFPSAIVIYRNLS